MIPWKGALRQVGRTATGWLVKVLPTRQHVVVCGYPPDEGNAVEVVRALARRYPGRVYWFDAPADGPSSIRRVAPGGRVRAVSKRRPASFVRYATAETVFYTHGLYGGPPLSRRRTIVNLWHGDGMKRIAPEPGSSDGIRLPQLHPCDYVVGSTEYWTRLKGDDFRVRADHALVVGNPRTDQLFRPVSDDALASLGLGGAGRFVLWMPTYRSALGHGLLEGWTEVAPTERVQEIIQDRLTAVAARLAENGLVLAVKAHPMDAAARDLPGVVSVTSANLARAGLTLYELIGSSRALISDYSSVWTDYLLLDRPMGFLIPDRVEYERVRGVTPADILDWLPGTVLDDPRAVDSFVDDVLADGRLTAGERSRAASRLGLRRLTNVADELLDELARRGVLELSSTVPPRHAAV